MCKSPGRRAASVRAVAGAVVLASLALSSTGSRADVAPSPPQEGEEDRQPGVVDFLIGAWSPACSQPERIVFDSEGVSLPGQSGGPLKHRLVARSIRHDEFGLIHTPAGDGFPTSDIVVFQILDDDTIRVIAQVEDGKPLDMAGPDFTLLRCSSP